MNLPEEDERYLKNKGYSFELHPSEDGNGFLVIIRKFKVSKEKFQEAETDLMIQIPKGYPDAALDMFWVFPHLRYKENGQFPQNADQMRRVFDKDWQRFSRHLRDPWKPGVDGLPGYMTLIKKELQNLP